MNEWHIVPICSVSSVDKCDIWKLLCELDLAARGYEEEVDMPIPISGVLKSPEILGIPINFLNESLDRAETLKSLLPLLGNYVVNLPTCNQCMRILFEEVCDNVSRCYTRSMQRANSGNFRICRPAVLRVLRVINRGIMIVISIMDLYFPSTPFCPKDTDFKRAFGHPCTCVAKDSFTSLDTTFRAPHVAASYCRRLTLILDKVPSGESIALEARMEANNALRVFKRGILFFHWGFKGHSCVDR